MKWTKPRKAEEEGLHVFVADALRRFGRQGVVWWHTPNGGKRSKAAAARLKRMGVLAGVWDFQLVDEIELFFLEIKSSTGTLSKEQKAFRDSLKHIAKFAVVKTPEEAVNALLGWAILTKDPLRRVEELAA